MKISDVMTTSPHILPPTTTVLEAAKKMYLFGCGVFPVGDAEHIIGVVTDHDIVVYIIAEGRNPRDTEITEAMKTPVATMHQNGSLLDAICKMKELKVRRILASDDNGHIVGILSFRDIFRRGDNAERLASLFETQLGG